MSEMKNLDAIDFDRTLKLLTQVEVPEGLAERVKARLKTRGEVIAWPKQSVGATWMRRAAAAGIVFVIGGGSWMVYSGAHFATGAGAGQKPLVMPSQQGTFGNANAIRKVDPLTAPVVKDREQGSGIRDQKTATPAAIPAKSGEKKVVVIGK
jgi:hypothetical protein